MLLPLVAISVAAESPIVFRAAASSFVVYFERGSAKISQQGRLEIERQSRELKKNPHDLVEIVGYTSGWGTKKYIESLGLKRANAVSRQLVDLGIDMKRVTVRSGGRYAKHTEHRAEKRRAEIKITAHES